MMQQWGSVDGQQANRAICRFPKVPLLSSIATLLANFVVDGRKKDSRTPEKPLGPIK